MVEFKSDMSVEDLINKWDEHTSISRFAGNDETMDLIFVAKRKGNKVKLVRRARSAYEPFAAVFRGEIKKDDCGSKISGTFTKSIADYISIAAVVGLLFCIRAGVVERGGPLGTVNVLLACAIIAGVALLYNTRASKRKYADFIARITCKEHKLFLSKDEKRDNDEDD